MRTVEEMRERELRAKKIRTRVTKMVNKLLADFPEDTQLIMLVLEHAWEIAHAAREDARRRARGETE